MKYDNTNWPKMAYIFLGKPKSTLFPGLESCSSARKPLSSVLRALRAMVEVPLLYLANARFSGIFTRITRFISIVSFFASELSEFKSDSKIMRTNEWQRIINRSVSLVVQRHFGEGLARRRDLWLEDETPALHRHRGTTILLASPRIPLALAGW